MNFAILTIVLLYTIALAYNIRKRKKEDAQKEKSFWDREHDANFTRKKSIDNLDYIVIPEDVVKLISDNASYINEIISHDESENHDENTDYCKNIIDLKDKKILNLNGITNTDLKLTYGASNLTELSDYDQNYSTLIVALDRIANIFYQAQKINEATLLLEYATYIHTDIARSYEILSDIYISSNKKEMIHLLIKNSESINSIRKNSIIRQLNKKLDS